MSNQKSNAHRRLACLLLSALTVISVAACQRASAASEQWAPSYLKMHLHAGEVQVQAAEGSEWATMGGKARFTLEERSRIVADAVEGAQLFLGDGSTLELDPGTVLELRNPRTLPRLQVIVQDGSLLFLARKPSYEFVTPAGLVTLLSIPSLIRIEVQGETTRLSVEEGAAICQRETETRMLPRCWEMYIEPGKSPEVSDFCSPSTTVPPSTPSLALPEVEPTTTPSPTPSSMPSPTPSPTPTPTPELMPTPAETVPSPTPTPPPPTNTPTPPARRKPTKPPPTQPPPTDQPPTRTPLPPPPTEPRPTPTSQPPPTEPRPTVSAGHTASSGNSSSTTQRMEARRLTSASICKVGRRLVPAPKTSKFEID